MRRTVGALVPEPERASLTPYLLMICHQADSGSQLMNTLERYRRAENIRELVAA
jgi:hypothetical protein